MPLFVEGGGLRSQCLAPWWKQLNACSNRTLGNLMALALTVNRSRATEKKLCYGKIPGAICGGTWLSSFLQNGMISLNLPQCERFSKLCSSPFQATVISHGEEETLHPPPAPPRTPMEMNTQCEAGMVRQFFILVSKSRTGARPAALWESLHSHGSDSHRTVDSL